MNTELDILNHISLNDKLMTTCKCFNHCFGCWCSKTVRIPLHCVATL